MAPPLLMESSIAAAGSLGSATPASGGAGAAARGCSTLVARSALLSSPALPDGERTPGAAEKQRGEREKSPYARRHSAPSAASPSNSSSALQLLVPSVLGGSQAKGGRGTQSKGLAAWAAAETQTLLRPLPNAPGFAYSEGDTAGPSAEPRIQVPQAGAVPIPEVACAGPEPAEASASRGANSASRQRRRVPSKRVAQLKTEAELARYDWMTQEVPSTQEEAFRLFFTRPAILASVAAATTALVLRLVAYEPSIVDLPVALAVILWWMLQEWVIHAKLLHSPFPWWGKDIHIAHHNLPYHHISIDGFKVVLPTMAAALVVFRLIFQDDSLLLTALASYYFMGILYEWTHFLVHTRVPMRSYIGRVIKGAHVKHHLRDENYWFSFTCPPIDNLMGTTPDLFKIG